MPPRTETNPGPFFQLPRTYAFSISVIDSGARDSSNSETFGYKALFANTSGVANTAVGQYALVNNAMASNNVAVGESALLANTSGYSNTGIGTEVLISNSMGAFNTASGYQALRTNSTGSFNTANGYGALYNTTNGFYNTAVGANADVNSGGYSNSSAFGYSALISASNQVRVGNSTVTSIGGYAGWTTLPSDKRVKKNIKENVPGLAFINKLKPVTYNLDINAIDKIVQRPAIKDKDGKIIQPSAEEITARKQKEQIVYTGFVAQDVEAAANSLQYDFSGVDKPKNEKDLYGLRYAEFVVPLVKAVQELSKLNNDKDAKINDLETRLVKLETMMNMQSSTPNSKLQTINISNASLEQNKPNPFNQSTTIKYFIASDFHSAQLIVTDLNGKNVKRFEIKNAGYGQQTLAASELASGVYQYTLILDGKAIDSKKMELLR